MWKDHKSVVMKFKKGSWNFFYIRWNQHNIEMKHAQYLTILLCGVQIVFSFILSIRFFMLEMIVKMGKL